jgi:hypothetical protein
MNIAAHRTITPTQSGPKPAVRHLSARSLTALVSQLTTGHLDPRRLSKPRARWIRTGAGPLERSVLGGGMGTELWRVIVQKHPAMDRELGRAFADAAHALLEAGPARLI